MLSTPHSNAGRAPRNRREGCDGFGVPEQSFAQDAASLVAMVAFVASVAVVLAGVLNVGVPV